MDQRLKKICKLLESPDNMRRCGAAAVLAELAPKDSGVIKALGEALNSANQTLTFYLLEAMEAIGSPSALPHVMPLLSAEDMATRIRAVSIVSKAGSKIVPQIKLLLTKARPNEKFLFIDLLARIHSREAYRIILDLLFDPDFRLVKEACEAVRRHVKNAGPKARISLHRQIVQFTNSARVKKRERVLTSCLLMLGSVGRSEARTILLKYSAPKTSLYVRLHALIGMKGLECSGAAAKAIARKVSAYLDDPDPDIVRHTVEVIGRLPASCFTAAQWRKLLKSKHASVRSFAARTLVGIDTASNNRLLVELLDHEDNNVSEIAASTLSRRKKATRILLDALAGKSDPDSAWRLAKVLKPHSDAVDKKTLKKFVTLAARELQAGKPRHEALLYFLRNIDPKIAQSVLLETGLKYKRAGKWEQAGEYLRRLLHTETFDNDISYALTVCDLKLSPKELAPHLSARDCALRGLPGLLRNKSFKLLEQFKKNRALNAADLFYVGFHFSEGVGDEKEFGEQLLEHIVKKWPTSKQGKAARNKLKLIRPQRETARRKTVRKTVRKVARKTTRKTTRKTQIKKTKKRRLRK